MDFNSIAHVNSWAILTILIHWVKQTCLLDSTREIGLFVNIEKANTCLASELQIKGKVIPVLN
jgi:hypothetical protein